MSNSIRLLWISTDMTPMNSISLLWIWYHFVEFDITALNSISLLWISIDMTPMNSTSLLWIRYHSFEFQPIWLPWIRYHWHLADRDWGRGLRTDFPANFSPTTMSRLDYSQTRIPSKLYTTHLISTYKHLWLVCDTLSQTVTTIMSQKCSAKKMHALFTFCFFSHPK